MRDATVLFADLIGGSALAETAGDPAAAEMIALCLERLKHVTTSNGGRVVKTIGDGILTIFPAPGIAADAAATMQREINALPEAGSAMLGVRIAFHSGPVIEHRGDVLGDTVRLAARLIEQANREQIVTSSGTAASLGRSYKSRVRDLRKLNADGKDGEVALCEVSWRESAPKPRSPSEASAPFRLRYGFIDIVPKWTETGAVKIGRDSDCSVIVTVREASRRHCTIKRVVDDFVLIDHSTNGTYVTEEGSSEILLLGKSHTLRRHGWISLGKPRAATDQVLEYLCGLGETK
jgi:class 3 adenylate cyclase